MAYETGGGPGVQVGSGADTVAYLAADMTFGGITDTDITGVTFTAAAGEVWAFDVWIDTDPGPEYPRFALSTGGTGSPTIHWDYEYWSAPDVRDGINDIVSFTTTPAVGTIEGRRWYRLRGRVTASTGPVVMQLKQGSGIASTKTVYAGTHVRCKKLN